MKVHDQLIALLTPLFPGEAELRAVDGESDDTIVRVEWPSHAGNAVNVIVDRMMAADLEGGDRPVIESMITDFVAQRLREFEPRDDIAVQMWRVPARRGPPADVSSLPP